MGPPRGGPEAGPPWPAWGAAGGTGEVGVGLGGDVCEAAEGVGAEQEVVLHEDEVPRQPRRSPHQRHHCARLSSHLQRSQEGAPSKVACSRNIN